MVIEMLLNNDIQLFFCSNDFKLLKGNKFNYVHCWIIFKSRLESFHLNKISIKYEFSKFMFCNVLNELFDKYNVM
jgi:hypothetical protein